MSDVRIARAGMGRSIPLARVGLPRASRGDRAGYLFTAPFLIVYVFVLLAPLAYGIYISFHDWDLLGGEVAFVGAANYVRMLTADSRFWTSLWHTVQFTVISSPLIIAVGLLQAVALNRAGRSMVVLRGIFFASYVLSISVITLIWYMLLHPTQGLIGEMLSSFGIRPIAWLSDPSLAMPAIVVTTLWWSAGFNTVVFLAGLQDIPVPLYEAAALDGAGPIRSFRSITIPMLRRPLVLVLITQVVWSFQIFGQVWLMTKGGPNGATRVLVQYIYETGFRDLKVGYASAMATGLFVLMLVVSLVQYRAATGKGD
jgi:multiple sugar transport system permease protein